MQGHSPGFLAGYNPGNPVRLSMFHPALRSTVNLRHPSRSEGRSNVRVEPIWTKSRRCLLTKRIIVGNFWDMSTHGNSTRSILLCSLLHLLTYECLTVPIGGSRSPRIIDEPLSPPIHIHNGPPMRLDRELDCADDPLALQWG